MFSYPILLKSDSSGLVLLIVALLFFSPTLFVSWHFLKGKLNKSNFINEFIKLAALVIKADGEISLKEKQYVHYFLEKQFGKKKLEYHKQQLDVFLESEKSIYHTLKNIDENQDPKTKIQLLHFLVKIAIIDAYLTNSEFIALSQICKGIGLKPARLTSILSMHSFVSENEHKQKQANGGKSRYKRSTSKIDAAYSTLEINKNATDKEIKKSYRKLVILYHPDKLIKLSESQKESSKELYLKINEAYELLKANRRFK